jgi:hypothetical protein
LQWLAKEMATFSPEVFLYIQDTVESLADVYFSSRYPGFDLEDPDWESFDSHHKIVKGFFEKVNQFLEP